MAHLTLFERLIIDTMLKACATFYAIARALSRPTSTIVREIKNRSVECLKSLPHRIINRCIHRDDCPKQHVCAHCTRKGLQMKTHLCRLCNLCNNYCSSFVEYTCEKLNHPPFVCNGCHDKNKCVLRKKFYIPDAAQKVYQTRLSETRRGITISEKELLDLDALLSSQLKKGQSIYSIWVNNQDRFPLDIKSVYRLINLGALRKTKRADLPQACKRAASKRKGIDHKVDKTCRIGRTYEDYQEYINSNPGLRIVQMDTVESVKGSKVLLTLLFCPFNFMLGFLLESKTSACVCDAFKNIHELLKKKFGQEEALELFMTLFPLILTDNGTEFSNPNAIEKDTQGNVLTRIFYCHPNASYEKGRIERNHVEVRKILPKGSSYFQAIDFNSLTQADISLALSHINSYVRKTLHGKSPYELFTKEFGEEVAHLFSIERIASQEIILKPELLGLTQKLKETMTLNN